MTWRLIHADCIEAMAAMEEASVDAIVCDPPYALEGGFMGKAWDRFDGREATGFGYYLAGLTDGEGSFRVQRHERGTHTCGFAIHLRLDDLAILQRAQRFAGVGTITTDQTGGRSPMARWAVQDKEGCAVLVGLFRRFPLAAKKALDFDVWAEAVEEWIERPRGNRWHGPADQDQAARFKARIERMRLYMDPPWSGHRYQDWTRTWAEEALRVLKPGGHAVVMGGTRTFHRMTAGLEDAGFQIRDVLSYLYGSGFPKSLNLDGGLGTALKPAWEACVLARKPLMGSVATNVERFGTGALNIDGTRIGTEVIETTNGAGFAGSFEGGQNDNGGDTRLGRWPANVVLDPEAAALLDAQTGEVGGRWGHGASRVAAGGYNEGWRGLEQNPDYYGDRGGASRFFYCPKADREERDRGLEGFALKAGRHFEDDGYEWATDGRGIPRAAPVQARNSHPTVKPVELMRWLVKLITPPGGTVLDPFTGSGSTGIAALREGFDFIGIEREADYVEIARARIQGDAPLWNIDAEVSS